MKNTLLWTNHVLVTVFAFSSGLFAAGVQPFGAISIAFIAMAALELRLGGQGILAIPGSRGALQMPKPMTTPP